MSGSRTTSEDPRAPLWPLVVGSLLLGFELTITWSEFSVIGWTDGASHWDFLTAAVKTMGWLLGAFAIWRVARSQRRVAHPWADPLGISLVATGAALAALSGLVQLGFALVGTYSPFATEGLWVGELVKADAGVTAASFLLIAIGASVALRAASRHDGISQRWTGPWRTASAGAAAIALGSLIVFGLETLDLDLTTGVPVYVSLALVALGWLVIALAVEGFRRVATAESEGPRSVAFYVGEAAAVLFSISPVLYAIVLSERTSNGFSAIPIVLRWQDAPTAAGWLCVAVASLAVRSASGAASQSEPQTSPQDSDPSDFTRQPEVVKSGTQ
jgi:hypothetical protein